MSIPCLVGPCPGDEARAKLDSETDPTERKLLEASVAECEHEHADPWDATLTWPGCPGRAAFGRYDIGVVADLRQMAALSPLAGWPDGYASWVGELWALVESERARIVGGER